jgi:hypothetical protein
MTNSEAVQIVTSASTCPSTTTPRSASSSTSSPATPRKRSTSSVRASTRRTSTHAGYSSNNGSFPLQLVREASSTRNSLRSALQRAHVKHPRIRATEWPKSSPGKRLDRRASALDSSTTVDSSLSSLLPGRGLLDSRIARGIEDALMVVVPADALVLVPCLAEHQGSRRSGEPRRSGGPQQSPSRLAALGANPVLESSQRSLLDFPHNQPAPAGRTKHQRRLPDRVVAGRCTGGASPRRPL